MYQVYLITNPDWVLKTNTILFVSDSWPDINEFAMQCRNNGQDVFIGQISIY